MEILIGILATVPAFVLLVYIYRKDKVDREPIRLLALLFVGGCVSVIPAALIEDLLATVLAPLASLPIAYAFVENFFGVALVEEGCKFAVLLFAWKNKAFDHLFDGVVYAVCVSLGFAALENVFYVLDAATIGESLSILAARTVLSIPGHMFFGVFMGLFYGRAKCASVRGNKGLYKRNIALALVYPIAIHGFYDFALSVDIDVVFLLFIVFIVALYVVAFRTIGKAAKADACFIAEPRVEAMQPQPQPQLLQFQPQAQPLVVPPQQPQTVWYCIECGHPNDGRFCSNCGTPCPLP